MHLNLPERQLLIGSQTFKKETLQKHVTGGHICACNAILAKQQPLETMQTVQSFQKGEKKADPSRKESTTNIHTANLRDSFCKSGPLNLGSE